jgi:hypothetical protein
MIYYIGVLPYFYSKCLILKYETKEWGELYQRVFRDCRAQNKHPCYV